MKSFSKIKTVDPRKKQSYFDKVFLTFDIDWAHDSVIENTLDFIESYDLNATFFVTHDTPLLDRIKANEKFELGIHPNFNPLFEDSSKGKRSVKEIMDDMLQIVPEATSLRSHSLTQSEKLLDVFAEYGISHVSNTYIPLKSNETINPWQLWSNIVILPHIFQDNVELKLNRKFDNKIHSGLNIYDFHPIHIYLNTENLMRYESSRKYHHDPESLCKYCNEDIYGIRDILQDLIEH